MTLSIRELKTDHRVWTLTYHSSEPISAFQTQAKTICAGTGTSPVKDKDQPVGHPEPYELRRYRIGEPELALSLKDKAALRQTVVFLRVQGKKKR